MKTGVFLKQQFNLIYSTCRFYFFAKKSWFNVFEFFVVKIFVYPEIFIFSNGYFIFKILMTTKLQHLYQKQNLFGEIYTYYDQYVCLVLKSHFMLNVKEYYTFILRNKFSLEKKAYVVFILDFCKSCC